MAIAKIAAVIPVPHEHRAELAHTPVLDRLWSASWDEIKDLEVVPGSPIQKDEWVIPASWASGGSLQARTSRTIKFARALPDGWQREEDRSEVALRRMKRISALIFLLTLRLRRRVTRPPKPSTWVLNCQALIRAARQALTLPRNAGTAIASVCRDGPPIFQDLSPDQVAELATAHPSFARTVVARLNALLEAGAFDDWPAADVAVPVVAGRSWQPFNDSFTAAIGHAAVWMLDALGPDLITCWEELRCIQTTVGGSRRRCDVNERRKSWLANWGGPRLTLGSTLEYQFLCNVSEVDDASLVVVDTWPPRLPLFVRNMVSLLQAAHMIILALSTGARDGELADLLRDCLDDAWDQDLLIGQTYKLSDSSRGERRKWPLPKVAVQAIKQQARIAEIVQPGGARLFVPFSARSEGSLHSLGAALVSFSRRVRLPDGRPLCDLCEGSVHLHRFRMTVVRLAALSLAGSNQILFDVLGHRDPEMTLAYILSDPTLQDDMRQIAYEASIALAARAIGSADANGGPAAALVQELAGRLAPRSAEHEMEAHNLNSAAEILAQNGRVMLVKPGVLCTKTFNQFGQCTRRGGSPEIGNCGVNCMHRLELAAARVDHRKAIEQILDSIPPEGGMMRAWWQGQLLSHLSPFEDLRTEMLSDVRVQRALGDSPQTAIVQSKSERPKSARRGRD
jgi:integrase